MQIFKEKEKLQLIKNSFNLAIRALKKEIPQQPHENYKQYLAKWCGCGYYLGYKDPEKRYCLSCGQKIDWTWKNKTFF